jgi:hypothetical protein
VAGRRPPPGKRDARASSPLFSEGKDKADFNNVALIE